MTRPIVRDALSALAAATLAAAAPGGPALAHGKVIKVYHAAVALDAVRGFKDPGARKGVLPMDVAKNLMPLAGPAPLRTASGHDRRWWQDYGRGRHSQPSAQKELSLSDEQRAHLGSGATTHYQFRWWQDYGGGK